MSGKCLKLHVFVCVELLLDKLLQDTRTSVGLFSRPVVNRSNGWFRAVNRNWLTGQLTSCLQNSS